MHGNMFSRDTSKKSIDQPQNDEEWKASQPSREKGQEITAVNKCTQICGDSFGGKSCAKIVLVKLSNCHRPYTCENMYAIIDDQSNRTLANSTFF